MFARTVEHVRAALREKGLDIEIQTFETPTATSQQAADNIGTELGSIVKSLCFVVNGNPVLVLAAGDQRVDERKIATLYDVGRKKCKLANGTTALELTGYTPGGVPPIGHTQEMPVLIDATLQRYITVYAAGGSANSIFPIPFETLVTITEGQVTDLVRVQETQADS